MKVRKTCKTSENTLAVRLRLLYSAFKEKHKTTIEEMKKDFLQKSGTPPLFQTDQKKSTNLKREHDFLKDANVQMIKRLKHSEMCMRNL